jgi:hypothetical protein
VPKLLLDGVGSPSISVETNRPTGDSADSFEAERVDRENMPGAMFAHMLGQSSMGNRASNIEGGIIALNCITAALDLNSGHAYSALHRSQRFTTTARFL